MKTIALAFSLLATVGCSTLPHGTISRVDRDQSERHGTTAVHAGRAKALVSGPALIRHLETEGGGAVALYLADDPGIADRACPSAGAEGASAVAVLADQSRLTNLTVPAGSECASRPRTRRCGWRGTRGRATRRCVPSTSRCSPAEACRTPDVTCSSSNRVAPEAGRKEDDRTLAIALLAGAPDAARRAWDEVRTDRPAHPAAAPRFRSGSSRISCRRSSSGCSRASASSETETRCATFVVNICLGVAHNELRRRRVRRRLGLTDTGTLPDRPIGAADFEARQALARCRRLLDGLGDDDRALFVLRYVEKLELTEVARRPRLVALEDEATAAACHRARHAPDAARPRARRIRHATTSTTSNDNNRKEGDQR